MLLAVHAATGALIGNSVESVILAFGLGFVSHFILDFIPHGDSHLIEDYYHDNKPIDRKIMGYITIDAIITATLILFLFGSGMVTNSMAVAAGIFGAILPDLFAGLNKISNSKLFRRFNALHLKNQLIFKKQPPLRVSFIAQLILVYLLTLLV